MINDQMQVKVAVSDLRRPLYDPGATAPLWSTSKKKEKQPLVFFSFCLVHTSVSEEI